MTMTMSDNNTEPSAPLDLRTRGRDLGSCSNRAAGTECHPGDTINAKVAEYSSRTSSVSSTIKRDSDECKISPANMPSNGRCAREADSHLRSSETSPSKLPLRKRPFPPDSKHVEELGSNVEPLLPKDSKTDWRIRPSPAKVPKCNRNRSNVEDHQFITPVPGGSGCLDHVHTVQPYCYTYYVPPYKRLPASLHLSEDTDYLLNEVALATRQDEDGDTSLHIAVVQENEAVVYWLIHILRRARKDLDLYNNLRQTPLHLAVITHQPRIVLALLQGGADPGALDRNGQTTLHLCCEHNQAECLSVILCHLARPPRCWSGLLDSRNYEGMTPLHLAVQDRNKKLAKMLLDSGADINAVDVKSGRSPLVHAVEISCMDMVNFLIENGCSVNSQSYSGNTALHMACGRGDVEAVRVLLRNGADSSLKNYHNDTAVMVAKNKKVSDVLRGKATRGQFLKTEQSFNDSPSPNNLSHSPLATPNPQCSASLSPVALRTHSPHSQSGESISGNQSPMGTQEKEDVQMRPQGFHNVVSERADCRMSFHSIHVLQPSHYDAFLPSVTPLNVEAFMSSQPRYYPPDVRRPLCPSEAPLIIFPAAPPGRGGPPPHVHTSTFTQSRPSSHNSDQSDTSNTSVSSEGKGAS
ncbi:B-cell lymphoma 3 protein homolog [Brachyhypopomus gauderio]|uniref:B-cell lymphoma 3 protein homolog n=1 Tax=Brachyhypopomus gauderio TaxID=698409 RepID=UPI0040428EDD